MIGPARTEAGYLVARWGFHYLAHVEGYIIENYDAILEACCTAWQAHRSTGPNHINRDEKMGTHQSGLIRGGRLIYVIIPVLRRFKMTTIAF